MSQYADDPNCLSLIQTLDGVPAALDKLTSLLSTNGCLLMDDSQQNTKGSPPP